jgi:NitT/TauT family transport system permease protein
MKEERVPLHLRVLPLLVTAVLVILWAAAARIPGWDKTVPSPWSVALAFGEELRAGRLMENRLFKDIVASIWRVMTGFGLAVLLGVPLGLLIGLHRNTRVAMMPIVNFFRSLSPLAWIPFAVLWFQIGNKPAVFLIFMASFFPMVVATAAAVANIPQVHFRVARDYGLRGPDLLTQVTLPAIMPQVITALRVTAGLSWVVVVAAEMIAGTEGLGFLIWDARNGLRNDLLVVGMIVIGLIGVLIDRLLMQLARVPSVRWGYER